jgi:ElaB/YqjD/DUF883 family membrane-anchored ribosome-binding protein
MQEHIMNAPREQLVADLKILMADVEDLVRATATQSGDKIAEVRGRIQQAAADLKPRLAQAQVMLKDKANIAAATTDDYVHDHPWTAMGVSAGIGLIIGLLIGRR